MPSADPFLLKHAKWSLVAMAICFPLVGMAATAVTARFRNEITSWADPASSQAREFATYRQSFGPGEFVLLMFPRMNGSDRGEQLGQRLKDSSSARWFKRVISSHDIHRYLAGDLHLTAAQVQSRTSDLFVDGDDEFDSMMFELTNVGRRDRPQAFAHLGEVLAECEISSDQVHFAGLGHDLYVLDREGLTSPFKMVPWIMLVAFVLTYVFVRDLALALFINAFGTFTGCLSFTLIYLSGQSLNAILWPSPTLIMLLSISGALHLLAYFRESLLATDGSLYERNQAATRQMLAKGAKPVALCAITTALGMGSLMLSTTRPVQQFGVFGSLSVIASCGLLLILLPAWLSVFPPHRLIQRETPAKIIARGAKQQGASQFGMRKHIRSLTWSSWTSWVVLHRCSIIVSLAAVMLVGALAVPNIKTGGNLRNFFPQGHRVLRDAQAIETHLGPLSSIEVLLRFSEPRATNDLQRLHLINAITRRIVQQTPVESVLSAATFAPHLTRQARGLQVVLDKQKIRRLKPKWQDAGLVHMDTDDSIETWRLSARYSGLTELDVPDLSDQLKQIVKSQLALKHFPSETVDVIATGEFVLLDFVDRQFSRDLLSTYTTAFVLISLVVLAIVRSIRITLVCALPNLFPALVVLGTAGLLNQPLDVASLMTASLALGIAVDDTLHFVIRWRGDVSKGIEPNQALRNAVHHVGSAMIQTSVICGVSIFLYAFCGFLPTVRFGILLAAMLFAALVGDLILLPALLSTRCSGKNPA